MNIEISKGTIIDPQTKTEKRKNLFIKNDKIIAIGRKPSGFKPSLVIDASNQIVCPGFVEINAELNPTKERFEENFEKELRAAGKGGFTTICLTPSEERPLDTVASINQINQSAKQYKGPKVFCLGALTVDLKGEQLTEMFNLKRAGCLGLSNGDNSISNTAVFRNALLYAHTFDLKVFLSSQDKWLSDNAVISEGSTSLEKGLPSNPQSSELIELHRNIVLIKETGVKAHLKAITSEKSVKELDRLKNKITFDVSIFHALVAENEIDWMNSSFHIKPPLGSERDRDFLQKALFKKSIKVLSSLHRPRSQAPKEGAFEGSVPGATSFETFLPLLLKLRKNLKISLVEAIDYITNQPSQVLGLNTGRLSKNNPADICIFNPEHKWSSHPNTFQSTGKNSPFLDQDMTGKVTATISEGKIIFYDSKLIKITGTDIEKLLENNTVKSEQAKY